LTAILNAARAREIVAIFVYDGDRIGKDHGYDWLIGKELESLHVQRFIKDKPLTTPPRDRSSPVL
jgi:hypothetical protein